MAEDGRVVEALRAHGQAVYDICDILHGCDAGPLMFFGFDDLPSLCCSSHFRKGYLRREVLHYKET